MIRQASDRAENLIVSLTGAENALVVPKTPSTEEAQGVRLGAQVPSEHALIYAEESDMPSIEQLIRENRIAFAIFEREAHHVGYGRVMAATAIGVGTSVAGWVLLIAAFAGASLRINPYTALTFALGGIVLVITLAVALYGPPRRTEA